MALNIIILGTISILIAYFLGSISPGYFLGKLLKGKKFDIRKDGKNKNTGASNVYYVLGLWPAIITALFDLCKGAVAVIIAYLLNVGIIFILGSGLAVMLGHVFPFYLKFKGGRGAATAWGILIFSIILFIIHGFNTPLYLVFGIIALVLIVLLITRNQDLVAVLFVPITLFLAYVHEGFTSDSLLITLPLAWLFVLGVIKIFKPKKKNKDLRQKENKKLLK